MSLNQTYVLDLALSKKCDMTTEEMFAHYAGYMPGAGSCGEWSIFVDPFPTGKQVTLHNHETGQRLQRFFPAHNEV